MSAGGAGNVIGYNFSIDNIYGPAGFMQASYWSHSDGDYMNLFEGNIFNGIFSDQLHGTSGLVTMFRNWLNGQDYNTYGGSLGNKPTTQTYPIDADSYNRELNIIANVLGTPGYHTAANGGSYEAYPPNNYTNAQCDHSIYEIGWGGGICASSANVANDVGVRNTMMRWGNYDVLTGTVRWDATESSPGASTYVNANATPMSHTLPASFYQLSIPSFWNVASGNQAPWPGIGPDVSGGSGPGGYAYPNAAANCYFNVMKGPTDGSGSALSFDSANCYYGVAPPPVLNPPSPTVVVH